MEKIWNERNEWQTMLNVEIAACEANAELGRIPKEAVEVIKAKADFDVDRIQEIDREILKMDKLKQEAQAAVLERSDNIQEDCVHSI